MGKFNLLTTLTLNASGLGSGLKDAKGAVKDYADKTKAQNKEVNMSFRDVSEMGIGEMRKELRALRNVSFAGKAKAEIDAINARAGELFDTMEDLRVTQEAYGAEFGAAMAGGLQTLSAIGEVGIGVATIFGANEDQAKKYQQAMVQLIGVTQALGVIENASQQKQLKTIGIKIKSVFATNAQTAATGKAATAQGALNAVMLANPVYIYAAAVAALAAGLAFLIIRQRENTREMKAYYDSMKSANDLRIESRKQEEQTAQEAFKNYNKQIVTVEKLVNKINDENTGLKEKKATLQQLIALDPAYLNGLTQANVKTTEGQTIIQNYLST